MKRFGAFWPQLRANRLKTISAVMITRRYCLIGLVLEHVPNSKLRNLPGVRRIACSWRPLRLLPAEPGATDHDGR